MGKLRASLILVFLMGGVRANIACAQVTQVTVRAEVPAGSGRFTQHSYLNIYMCNGVPMVHFSNGSLVPFTDVRFHHNGPGPNTHSLTFRHNSNGNTAPAHPVNIDPLIRVEPITGTGLFSGLTAAHFPPTSTGRWNYGISAHLTPTQGGQALGTIQGIMMSLFN